MKRLPYSSFQNINAVFWQLFYIVCCDQFSRKGWFIVDQVDLRPNNSITDKKLVAVIKAHLREEPNFKVEATSDKFHF